MYLCTGYIRNSTKVVFTKILDLLPLDKTQIPFSTYTWNSYIVYYSVPLLFVFFCRNSGLRAVLIFRRWSKYIKNAKFYAESNGYIADVWRRRNYAAIWFLLKWCFRCRIEYHRYRRKKKKWRANQTNDTFYPFRILRSTKISQNLYRKKLYVHVTKYLSFVSCVGIVLTRTPIQKKDPHHGKAECRV